MFFAFPDIFLAFSDVTTRLSMIALASAAAFPSPLNCLSMELIWPVIS